MSERLVRAFETMDRRFKSCHSDQYLARSENLIPNVSPNFSGYLLLGIEAARPACRRCMPRGLARLRARSVTMAVEHWSTCPGSSERRTRPHAVAGAICASAPRCRHAARSTPWDDLQANPGLLPVQRHDPDEQ